MKIMETPIEFCVIAEYKDGNSFCVAKFMHEEPAKAWLEQQEQEEGLTYRLFTRHDSVIGVRWEPVE